MSSIETKACSLCKSEKTLEDFYKHKTGKLGRQARCIDCCKSSSADYHQANKKTINARSLKNQQLKRESDPLFDFKSRLWFKFRMRLVDYESKLSDQGGVCAVCQQPPGRIRLAVDHDRSCCPGDRSCGACVRGLLCSGCNNGTGVTDSIPLLQRKIEYLTLWLDRPRP